MSVGQNLTHFCLVGRLGSAWGGLVVEAVALLENVLDFLFCLETNSFGRSF